MIVGHRLLLAKMWLSNSRGQEPNLLNNRVNISSFRRCIGNINFAFPGLKHSWSYLNGHVYYVVRSFEKTGFLLFGRFVNDSQEVFSDLTKKSNRRVHCSFFYLKRGWAFPGQWESVVWVTRGTCNSSSRKCIGYIKCSCMELEDFFDLIKICVLSHQWIAVVFSDLQFSSRRIHSSISNVAEHWKFNNSFEQGSVFLFSVIIVDTSSC